MPTIITRVYANRPAAAQVVDALKAGYFSSGAMSIVSGAASETGAPSAPGPLENEIRAAGVYPRAAEAYSRQIAGGQALLVVRAPFGQAREAVGIIDRFDSLPSDVEHTEVYNPQRSA
ncbi:MAG: hypothetical protein AAGL49_15125, partial [Pseudomonadota bacterium]